MDEYIAWSFSVCAAAAKYHGPAGHVVVAEGHSVDAHGPSDYFRLVLQLQNNASIEF